MFKATEEELLVLRDKREEEAGITFDDALTSVLSQIQAIRDEALRSRDGPTKYTIKVYLRPNLHRRWAEIVVGVHWSDNTIGSSLYGWVDTWSGALHNNPERVPRGNIFDKTHPCLGTYSIIIPPRAKTTRRTRSPKNTDKQRL